MSILSWLKPLWLLKKEKQKDPTNQAAVATLALLAAWNVVTRDPVKNTKHTMFFCTNTQHDMAPTCSNIYQQPSCFAGETHTHTHTNTNTNPNTNTTSRQVWPSLVVVVDFASLHATADGASSFVHTRQRIEFHDSAASSLFLEKQGAIKRANKKRGCVWKIRLHPSSAGPQTLLDGNSVSPAIYSKLFS